MKPYTDIPIWETKKRLQELKQFHMDVERYFLNSSTGVAGRSRLKRTDNNDAATQAKRSINRSLQAINRYIQGAGVNPEIYYQQPPVVGGREYSINIITNIFRLDELRIPVDMPDGFVQQAIGVYDGDTPASWRRTLNPFWWLGSMLTWFAATPFLLIGKAGFDADRAQHSVIGKLISLILYLIPIVASLLIILDLLGYLGPVKSYVSTMFGPS